MEDNKQLPTAIDYLYHAKTRDNIKEPPTPEKVAEWMHEYAVLFAKHHVQEALKQASMDTRMRHLCGHTKEVKYLKYYQSGADNITPDPLSVLNAYPPEKIV